MTESTDETTVKYRQHPANEAFTSAHVRFSVAAGPEREVALDGTAIVGTGEGSAIRIEGDRLVSRVHAELSVKDDGVWVRDLGSMNGTFINETRVESPAALRDGDVVHVGSVAMTFRAWFPERPRSTERIRR